MLHFVVFFITITILIIFLATKQRKPFDRFSFTAMMLLSVLAATSIVFLHGSDLFPASTFALAVLILIHRFIVQYPVDLDSGNVRSGMCMGMELGVGGGMCMSMALEASTHSTWIVAAFVAGVVSAFKV